MPELISRFQPPWWLPGPHLPTIWGKMVRRIDPVHDRLERIATPDGDHVTLVRMGTIAKGVPHLFILHGLEGKISAKYAHGLLEQARKLGWSGDMLMFRSCDGEVNAARRFYHSGETSDLDLVVRRLLAEHPDLHLVMCGVSLGGNVLLKWLGEQGDGVPAQVRRAAAVSTPYDLEAGARLMEHGFARIYVRHFLGTLVAKTARKLERYPDLCDPAKLRCGANVLRIRRHPDRPGSRLRRRARLLPPVEFHPFHRQHPRSDAVDECLQRSVPSAVGARSGSPCGKGESAPLRRVSCRPAATWVG